jgi:hypothetical protein
LCVSIMPGCRKAALTASLVISWKVTLSGILKAGLPGFCLCRYHNRAWA